MEDTSLPGGYMEDTSLPGCVYWCICLPVCTTVYMPPCVCTTVGIPGWESVHNGGYPGVGEVYTTRRVLSPTFVRVAQRGAFYLPSS